MADTPKPFSHGALIVTVASNVREDGKVDVADRWGNVFVVNTNVGRTGSLPPQMGERWIIDRTYGQFSFAAIASPRRGPRAVDSFDFAHTFMFGGY
jgi:hypothetical protein